jgi:glycosyltransferase involved in cell wall biosynthesis
MTPSGFSPPPEVSVVSPVYRNADTLEGLHARIAECLEGARVPFELIFVEDACPEGSLAVLERLALHDSRVAIISLAQNVGQHRAVLIGLPYARGKSIVLLDADLQDPPEVIPLLLRGLKGTSAAVFAGRRGAYESLPRLATSFVFKSLLHLVAGVPTDAGMFVAFDRRVADRLLTFRPRWPFVVAMIGSTGLPMTSIPIRRDRRSSGRSAYTAWGRLRVGIQTLAWAVAWRMGAGSAPTGGPAAPIRAEIGARFNTVS